MNICMVDINQDLLKMSYCNNIYFWDYLLFLVKLNFMYYKEI